MLSAPRAPAVSRSFPPAVPRQFRVSLVAYGWREQYGRYRRVVAWCGVWPTSEHLTRNISHSHKKNHTVDCYREPFGVFEEGPK